MPTCLPAPTQPLGGFPTAVSLLDIVDYLLCSGSHWSSVALLGTQSGQGQYGKYLTTLYSTDQPPWLQKQGWRGPLQSQALSLWVLEHGEGQGVPVSGARVGAAAIYQLVMGHFHMHCNHSTCERCSPCSQGAQSMAETFIQAFIHSTDPYRASPLGQTGW